jgi:hypothetical protein
MVGVLSWVNLATDDTGYRSECELHFLWVQQHHLTSARVGDLVGVEGAEVGQREVSSIGVLEEIGADLDPRLD